MLLMNIEVPAVEKCIKFGAILKERIGHWVLTVP